LPDARDGDAAKVGARPRAGHTHPAAGVLIFGAVAVPVEADFDAGEFVGVDLAPRWAGDDGGLRAVRAGF
jgi:hypothetical protein